MGGNTGEIQIGSERELYNKYINHQAGTTKASTIIILLIVQMYNIFRLLIGVPDYSSFIIKTSRAVRCGNFILHVVFKHRQAADFFSPDETGRGFTYVRQ